MYEFKDFKIKASSNNFIGSKIPIARVFNMKITVLDFKIDNSKQKENTDCLTLQIEKDGNKRVIFTGSTCLIEQIKQVPKEKFPFLTTIVVGENERYEFT